MELRHLRPVGGVVDRAHAASAALIAAISSSMRTVPSPSRSADAHDESGCASRAMPTARTSSSTVTMPSPSQSPTAAAGPVGVTAGVSVGVGVSPAVGVSGAVSACVRRRRRDRRRRGRARRRLLDQVLVAEDEVDVGARGQSVDGIAGRPGALVEDHVRLVGVVSFVDVQVDERDDVVVAIGQLAGVVGHVVALSGADTRCAVPAPASCRRRCTTGADCRSGRGPRCS